MIAALVSFQSFAQPVLDNGAQLSDASTNCWCHACAHSFIYESIRFVNNCRSWILNRRQSRTYTTSHTHTHEWNHLWPRYSTDHSEKKNMNEMNDNKCDRKTRKYIFNELNCFAWMRRSNCRLLNALNTSSSLSFQLFYLPHSNEERIKLHWAIFELDSNSIRSRYTSEGQTIDSCWNYSLEFILHFG